MFELENTNQLPLGLPVITCLACARAQERSLGTSRGKSLAFVPTTLIQKYTCLNPSACSRLNTVETYWDGGWIRCFGLCSLLIGVAACTFFSLLFVLAGVSNSAKHHTPRPALPGSELMPCPTPSALTPVVANAGGSDGCFWIGIKQSLTAALSPAPGGWQPG